RPQRSRGLRRPPRDALGARARDRPRAREQGEPGGGWRSGDGRLAERRRASPAGRQRTLRRLPVPREPRARDRPLVGSHRIRRPISRPRSRRTDGRDSRGRARASNLEHGAQDHGRLGDARQQRSRADRGALPVRARLRRDRGRHPPDVDGACTGALPRRRRDRAPRVSRHARADFLRAHLPRAGHNADSAPRPRFGPDARVEPPDLETFPLLALAREAGERGGTYPCAFNAANEVAVAAFLDGRLPFLAIAETVEETLESVDGTPAGDLNDLIEADAEARRLAERTAAAP